MGGGGNRYFCIFYNNIYLTFATSNDLSFSFSAKKKGGGGNGTRKTDMLYFDFFGIMPLTTSPRLDSRATIRFT